MIHREDQQFVPSVNGNGQTSDNSGSTPLSRFIFETLQRSTKGLTIEDFKEAAKTSSLNFGEKSPGRVIHWALVGMAQGGFVEKQNDLWQLKEVLK